MLPTRVGCSSIRVASAFCAPSRRDTHFAPTSHGQCQTCSGLGRGTAQCPACQDLPAVAAGRVGDEAEQLVHLEAAVGCEVDRCQQVASKCGRVPGE